MQGVVLAGGIGRRLSPLTNGKPKYLVSVHGKPMIWYPINALLNAGVEEIVIPVYIKFRKMLSEVIKEQFGGVADFIFIDVDDYNAGNGYSLLSAVPFISSEWFMVTMSDHIFDPEIPRALSGYKGDCIVSGDAYPIHISISEATKIYSPDGLSVEDIGKSIKYFNYIDMGIFKFRSEPIKMLYDTDFNKKYTVSLIVKWLIDKGYDVRLVDMSGYYWIDIDTIEEYWSVEKGLLSLLPTQIVSNLVSSDVE